MITLDNKTLIIILLVVILIGILIYKFVINKSTSNQPSELFNYILPPHGGIPYSESSMNYVHSHSKLNKHNKQFVQVSSVIESENALSHGMKPVDLNVLQSKLDTQYEIGGPQYQTTPPKQLYETIARNEPDIPNEKQIEKIFDECMKTGNTVEECLTKSNSGLYPGLTNQLCQKHYAPQSPICVNIASRQIKQMNNSGSRGPA